jgi:hypothetical protein
MAILIVFAIVAAFCVGFWVRPYILPTKIVINATPDGNIEVRRENEEGGVIIPTYYNYKD